MPGTGIVLYKPLLNELGVSSQYLFGVMLNSDQLNFFKAGLLETQLCISYVYLETSKTYARLTYVLLINITFW